MNDGIILRTGNSRWMKSAIPEDITHEELVALLRAGTFPFDLNGINEAGWRQLGQALNKASLLTDDTETSIWGSTGDYTVDEALAKLRALITTAQGTADGGARILTGSYIGSGTNGPDNPTSLSFSALPKFLYIKDTSDSYAGFFLPNVLTTSYANYAYQGFSENMGLQAANNYAKRSGLTLSWYSGYSVMYQLNSSGVTYRYFAIV